MWTLPWPACLTCLNTEPVNDENKEDDDLNRRNTSSRCFVATINDLETEDMDNESIKKIIHKSLFFIFLNSEIKNNSLLNKKTLITYHGLCLRGNQVKNVPCSLPRRWWENECVIIIYSLSQGSTLKSVDSRQKFTRHFL